MSNRLKYLLLPIAGALSAFLSFALAAPYVKSLYRPWLKPSDPEYHFTFGTLWTNVQHAAFGALLCGSFCFILEVGRRTPRRVLLSTILGTMIGGVLNSCADSGADYIGITAMRSSGGGGQMLGALAWFILVPMALSFSIAFAIGPTKQRIGRAIFSTAVAAIFTFVGRIIGSVVGAVALLTTRGISADLMNGHHMEASIPAWMGEAIAAGIALGLTMVLTDQVSRKASLRLVFGRNEYRDWSLDHMANRIGSGEVEIPIRGFKGIEPVHSCIFRQGHQFVFDSQHAPGLVNGYPVAQAVLNHGDTIQIGEATLVFYTGGPVRQGRQSNFPAPIMPQPMPMQPINYEIVHGQLVPAGPGPVMPVQPVQPVAAPAPQPQFFLVDLGGREISLASGLTTVGREVGNVLCLAPNTTVSRQHATLSVESGQVVVTDVGSANGTWVNKNAILGPTVLNSGDEISFGSAVFTLQSR